jgi:squalene-associated FAD-dependent desaturase
VTDRLTGLVHVVGAGLAGLAAAVALADAGRRVVLHEAAKAAGGRCRSYHDPALGRIIDNGNHLLLSGNSAARDFLARVNAPRDALAGADEAVFHFADLRSGARWALRPNAGRLPWWILLPSRRVPGTHARDYLAPLGLFRAGPGATIGEAMPTSGALWERLWQPVLLAALNTAPEHASAALAARVLRETLGAGGDACRPLVARHGLSAAFIDPALAWLAARGAAIGFGRRLTALDVTDERVVALHFGDEILALSPNDAVVLAVPAWIAAELLPDLTVPTQHRAIVNAHFAVEPPRELPAITGLIGGLSEWLFAYEDRLSVTISAADRLVETPREELAQQIWREVASVVGHAGAMPSSMPSWQIVKEKRATFAATPAEDSRRPSQRTHLSNLALAGDYTKTGLPATIEGAIRSGFAAASVALAA